MSTTWSSILLSLLSSCVLLLSNPTFVATALPNSSSNTHLELATVHVINGLPESSDPLYVSCSSKSDLGYIILKMGEDYKWSVQERALYSCGSMWRNRISSWHAYQPKRDQKHATVFWLIEENRISLSWDNTTWVKKAVWQFE